MPLPSTMTPIATQTLTASSATVTFSSIPQTYTDLYLVINAATGAYTDNYIRYNSDTGTNYSYTRYGYNSNATYADRGSSQSSMYFGSTDTTIVNTITHHIMNYSNSTTYKTSLGRNGIVSGANWNGTQTFVCLWRSTAAINSITLSLSSSTWSTGSSFTLYGIKAAS